MMEFLYFPEDKTEYIPAIIELVIFMILASVAMYFFLKYSKKEQRQFEQQYNEHNETKSEDRFE
ncbi:hypothetical protein WMZ97_19665 [Lentibacillus sp. N15]|uniref:hypothetical protein n=1 Tax=Lentibacillus songyuanensis TaxID=3136161 RepID=UPI0031BAC482